MNPDILQMSIIRNFREKKVGISVTEQYCAKCLLCVVPFRWQAGARATTAHEDPDSAPQEATMHGLGRLGRAWRLSLRSGTLDQFPGSGSLQYRFMSR